MLPEESKIKTNRVICSNRNQQNLKKAWNEKSKNQQSFKHHEEWLRGDKSKPSQQPSQEIFSGIENSGSA